MMQKNFEMAVQQQVKRFVRLVRGWHLADHLPSFKEWRKSGRKLIAGRKTAKGRIRKSK